MLQIFSKKSKEADLEEVSEVTPGCFVHVDDATTSDLEAISQLTKIPYADLLDCLDKYELPRVEVIENNLLIFTRYPTDQETGLYTGTLTFILTDSYMISICPHTSTLIKDFLAQKNKYSTTSTTKLLILLLQKISQEFTGQIRRVRYNVLFAEKEMISVESEDITAMTKNEEILNQYLSSLATTADAIVGVKSSLNANLEEKDHALLEDSIISLQQSEELCSNVIKSIRSLRDSYQIIFTNNLHKTIKLLTSLTIILSIPTMIASIYGMNVHLPLESHPLAFAIVIAGTISLTILGFWFFRRKGWL
ncbi:MAG: magnesium transporter CorA family protein [Verrucomicrobia bacterium]|nr:magnesium transporter CorA family protein [Verrucomicrobiota bacterium]